MGQEKKCNRQVSDHSQKGFSHFLKRTWKIFASIVAVISAILAIVVNIDKIIGGTTQSGDTISFDPPPIVPTPPPPVPSKKRNEKEKKPSENRVVALNPCEQMLEEKPVLRAVGKGSYSDEQTAKNIAEMQARAQFARAIASKIVTATSIFSSSNDVIGSEATDQVAKQNDFAISVAEEIVRNTVVIKTHKEQRQDNRFDVWVCLEYQGDVSKMENEIHTNVQQYFSEEQRTKMNSKLEQFRNRVQIELE